MSKKQRLRVLVNERLTAAAEEIFALFERTIAEYEEELRRAETENQRKQRLLDEANPGVQLHGAGAGVQLPPASPGPGLNQEITETPRIKEEPEEQSIKQEEEQFKIVVCVKTEESSQTQEEHMSSEPHFHPETVGQTEHSFGTNNNDNWEPPFSCSAAQMEKDDVGDQYKEVQTRDISSAAQSSGLFLEYNSAPGTSSAINNRDVSGITEEAEKKKHQCSVCEKRFGTKRDLQRHITVHTGDRPYSCSFCEKTFAVKGNFEKHKRIHTGEKPYNCSICQKTFNQKGNLNIHMRTHTNEKPYSCPFCEKTFARSDSLHIHSRIHTGEKPYVCPVCYSKFSVSSSLKSHMKTHTKVVKSGDRLYHVEKWSLQSFGANK